MIKCRSGRKLLAVGLLICSPALAQQSQIPALEDVPRSLPESIAADLLARHLGLANTRNLLRSRIGDHFTRCSVVSTNSPEHRECLRTREPLFADRDAYIANVKQFNWDLEQAVGGYRNGLERRLAEIDDGLKRDATALRFLGFERRAENFADWAKFSADAHRFTFLKVMDSIIDAGSDLAVKGLLSRLQVMRVSKFGADEARELLRQMEAQSLGNVNATRYLQQIIDRNLTKEGVALANELAVELHKDMRVLRDLLTVDKDASTLEKSYKLSKMFMPPHVEKGAEILELGVWVAYDVGAQSVASKQIRRLTELTEKDLKALKGIACVTQRRLVERHSVGARLAAVNNRTFDQPKPVVWQTCMSKP